MTAISNLLLSRRKDYSALGWDTSDGLPIENSDSLGRIEMPSWNEYSANLIGDTDSKSFSGWVTTATLDQNVILAPDGVDMADSLSDSSSVSYMSSSIGTGVVPILGSPYKITGYMNSLSTSGSLIVRIMAGSRYVDFFVKGDMTVTGLTSVVWTASEPVIIPDVNGWKRFSFYVTITGDVGTGNIVVQVFPAGALISSYTSYTVTAQGTWSLWDIRVKRVLS
ncbi:MAG TPA: hypothetical protein VN843_17000 [Anaerolineales bacterium]|nr:hypothetical protein [Anaerolineales bacterium]